MTRNEAIEVTRSALKMLESMPEDVKILTVMLDGVTPRRHYIQVSKCIERLAGVFRRDLTVARSEPDGTERLIEGTIRIFQWDSKEKEPPQRRKR